MAYTLFLTWKLDNNAPLPETQNPTNQPTNEPNNEPDNEPDDSEDELPKPVRIQLAHQAWINSKGSEKIKDVACRFGVAYTTLHSRINKAIPKELAS